MARTYEFRVSIICNGPPLKDERGLQDNTLDALIRAVVEGCLVSNLDPNASTTELQVATPLLVVGRILQPQNSFFEFETGPQGTEKQAGWIDRHSVNCVICGDLFDERDSLGEGPDGGSICLKHEAEVPSPDEESAWYFQMSSQEYGNETFGPYNSQADAEASMSRVKQVAIKLNDGIERRFKIIPPVTPDPPAEVPHAA